MQTVKKKKKIEVGNKLRELEMENMQIVPAGNWKNVEAQYVEMMVPLYSYGCEKKVKKTLSHLKGIINLHFNLKCISQF